MHDFFVNADMKYINVDNDGSVYLTDQKEQAGKSLT